MIGAYERKLAELYDTLSAIWAAHTCDARGCMVSDICDELGEQRHAVISAVFPEREARWWLDQPNGHLFLSWGAADGFGADSVAGALMEAIASDALDTRLFPNYSPVPIDPSTNVEESYR